MQVSLVIYFFNLKSVSDTVWLSKRGLSSILGRIYDPCGLLQLFILKGKLILQDTWTFKCGKGEPLSWDDRLPPENEHRWLKWIREIKECSKFQVGRYIFKNINYVPTINALELHGYSDAGDLCWGAAIYIRFYNLKTGNFEVHLIYSCSSTVSTNSLISINPLHWIT